MDIQNAHLKIEKDYIDVYVPLRCKGKFRCKTRNDFQEYGISFGPSSTIIPTNAYVEWQIGYDKVVGDEDKTTTLENLTFKGANKKQKNLYELSEIMYYLCQNKLFKEEELDNMIETIENIENFLQEKYRIQSSIEDSIIINEEEFYKSVITLPTFNKKNDSCSVTIQISIEKQQYGTGVQPMLYINIPVVEFENSDKIIGNTSKKEKFGILRINKEKIDIIKNVFICFGMCSSSHHHDILEILKIIKNNI